MAQPEGTGTDTRTYSFTIVQDAPLGQTVNSTVKWRIAAGSASLADFVTGQDALGTNQGLPSGTVTLANSQTQTITLQLNPDADLEGDETFQIVLESDNATTQAAIVTASSQGVITNDDFTLTTGSASALERDDVFGNATIDYVISRNGAIGSAATVNWSLDFSAGSAAASDFITTSGSFTFAADATSYTLKIPIKGDAVLEAAESFGLNLSYTRLKADLQSNGSTGTVAVTGELRNDDEAFSIDTIVDVNEGNNEGGVSNRGNSIVFVVRRNGYVGDTASVKWTLSGVSGLPSLDATDFTDGKLPSGTVNFLAGESTKTVSISTLKGDTVLESSESFKITLSSPGLGSQLSTDPSKPISATAKVLYDELAFAVEAVLPPGTTDPVPTVEEGSEGSTSPRTLQFKVVRSGGTGTGTVNWALTGVNTSDVTGADFVGYGSAMPSGQVVFGSGGANEQIISIQVLGDDIREADLAQLRLTLSMAPGSAGTLISGQSSADVILKDDDDSVSITALDPPLSEGNGSTDGTVFAFVVERGGDLRGLTTVNWAVAGSGTKPLSNDEIVEVIVSNDGILDAGDTVTTSLSGSLSFADATAVPRTLFVRVKSDDVGEADETFQVSLSDPSNKTSIVGSPVTQTVVNDDPVLTARLVNATVAEGQEGFIGGVDASLSFVIKRTGSTAGTSSVEWEVLSALTGNAVDALDFGGLFPSGVVTFSPGQAEKTIFFVTDADHDLEGDEGFLVRLQNPVNAVVLSDDLPGTLLNDDSQVRISSLAARGAEGNAGDTPSRFEFRLDVEGTKLAKEVTVTWHAEGFGLNPIGIGDFYSASREYAAAPFTLSAGSGADAGKLVLTWKTNGDIITTASLTLVGGAAVGATAVNGTSTTPEVLKIDTGALVPGAAYVLKAGSTVLLSAPLDATPTLAELVASLTASPDALGSNGGRPSGTTVITIDPNTGLGSRSLFVAIAGDNGVGPDEDFRVVIDSVTAVDAAAKGVGVTVLTGSERANATVYDDDARIGLRQSLVTVTEGDLGTTAEMRFYLDVLQRPLDAAAAVRDIAVGWEVELNQTDLLDFFNGELPKGQVIIPGTQGLSGDGAYIAVKVAGDFKVEQAERFKVRLTGANVVGSSGGVQIESSQVSAEGEIRPDDQGFAIVTNSQATQAESGALGTGAIYSFDIQRSGRITDALTLTWKLGIPEATLTGLGASANDFRDPVTGLPYATFTGPDGNYLTGTIQMAAGQARAINAIVLNVSLDQLSEANENFRLVVETTAADIAQKAKYFDGVINNDDGPVPINPTYEPGFPPLGSLFNPPTLTVRASSPPPPSTPAFPNPPEPPIITEIFEGGSPATAAVPADTPFWFTVNRGSGDLVRTATLKWKVTAVSPDLTVADFMPLQDLLGNNGGLPSGTVNFAIGQTTASVAIRVSADRVVELDEKFRVEFFSPTDAVLEADPISYTILNDDIEVSLEPLSSTRIVDGNAGTTQAFSFVITRTGRISQASTVNWALAATGTGPAMATGADFVGGVLPSGAVSFSAGETRKEVTILIQGDNQAEPDKGFSITLNNPINTTINAAATTRSATLASDDVNLFVPPPVLAAETSAGGFTPYSFTFSANGPVDSVVTVRWRIEGVSAGALPVTAADFDPGQDALGTNGGLPSGVSTFTLLAPPPTGAPALGTALAGYGTGTSLVTIKFSGDNIAEGTESFRLVLDSVSATGGSITPPSSPLPAAQILDDDVRIGIRQTTYSSPEGGPASADPLIPTPGSVMRFYIDALKLPTVTFATGAGDILINYQVEEVPSGSANANDFVGNLLPSGQLTVTADQLSNTDVNDIYIDVPINNDLVVEGSDRFVLKLTSARLVSMNGGVEILETARQVEATINNDDVAPKLTVSGIVGGEGLPFALSVFRPNANSATALTVDYRIGVPEGTLPGTGLAANDLLPMGQSFAGDPTTGIYLTGQLQFLPGSNIATMQIFPVSDDLIEQGERFRIYFEANDPAYAPAVFDGTIADDGLGTVDTPPPDPQVLGEITLTG